MATKSAKKTKKTTNKSDVSALEVRIKELEKQNAALIETTVKKPKNKLNILKSVGVTFFLTLSIVTFMLFNVASWAKNTILDTESFVSTMQPVLAEPAVQEAIKVELSDQLFTTIDVQKRLEENLPENVKFLAGPLAGGVESFVNDQLGTLLASPQVYDVWGKTLTTVHGALIGYIQDPTKDGVLSINDVYVFLGDKISSDSQIGFLFDKQLPENIGSFTIAEIEGLPQARRYVDVLSSLPIILIGTSIVSFLIAVALSNRRRLVILTVTSLSFVLMIATLGALTIGQEVVAQQVQPEFSLASEAVYSTITQPLRDRTLGYATLFGVVSALLILIAPTGYIAKARIYIHGQIVRLADKYVPKSDLPEWLYLLPENKTPIIWTVFGVVLIGFGLRIPPDSNMVISATITATVLSLVLYFASLTISATKK